VRPLEGIRVVDLSRVLAGPYCTMTLADLGADVVKVERPGEGDETRAWGPPYDGGEATYFLAVNRGKRSVALDLKDPEGLAAVRALVRRADVVIDNFRAGAAERLGLGPAAMRADNPGLVHCSITGFGSARQPETRAGYDFVVQAESGLMSITGEPGGPPAKVGVAVVDVLCGLNAATGILAALTRRERTGEGEHLEVSLLDSALAALVNVAQAALSTGEEATRHGNAHPSIVPYEPFEAADAWIAVAAPNDRLWAALCAVVGREDVVDDPRFATNDLRVRHRTDLVPLLAAAFRGRPADEWLALLEQRGVPAGKVRGVREAFAAAAAAGDPATVEVEHPTAGRLSLARSPLRLASAPTSPTLPPPLLGEHTEAVLREAGFDPSRLSTTQEPRP
jgi:crotonobetainyl-CoA:carnitine CoA-transferase CaiB-like acyl-CoA transferase